MALIKELINKYIRGNEIFSRFVNVFSVDVIVRGANFLLIPVFIALMTQREFGNYGYLYSFAMTLSGIINFGFYVAMTKLYSDTTNNKHQQGSMLFTITTSLLVLVAISMLIVYFTKIDIDFFSLLNKNNDAGNFYLDYRVYVFIAVLSMIFTNYLTFFFVSSEQIKKLQAFNLIRFFLANGTAVIVLYVSPLDAVMLRLAITYGAELFLTIVFGSFLFKRFLPVFDLYYLKKAFKLGLPIVSGCLLTAMVNFGDKFFVMKYAGADTFAVYNLGILFSSILLIVYQSFNFVWLPLFLKEKDLTVLKRKTKRYTLIIITGLSALGLLVWLGTYFALVWGIIKINYYDVLYILPVLIVAQIFGTLIGLFANFTTYFEKTHIQLFVGIILSVIGYFLYSSLVKEYLIMGASVSLLILNAIGFLFYYTRAGYYINNRLKGKRELKD